MAPAPPPLPLAAGLALSLLALSALGGQDPAARIEQIVVYPVRGPITPGLCKRLQRDVEGLVGEHAVQFIVFEIDTPGGAYEQSRQTASFIYDLDKRGVETFAYVPNSGRAVSAGTLLAFSCKYLAMGENTRIGDVAPVDVFGRELGEKQQTVVRNDLAYYARQRRYPVALAEAMVTKEIKVQLIEVTTPDGNTERRFISEQKLRSFSEPYKLLETVVESGLLLTLHEQEAYEYGLIKSITPSRYDLLEAYGLGDMVIREARELLGGPPQGAGSSIWLRILNHPFTKFLLLLGGILGFVIEFKIPGFGLPGALGLLCFTLFFLGGYLTGTVQWYDLGMFLLALALLAAELFLIPGFGIAGVLGLALLVTSLVLSLQAGSPETAGPSFTESLLVVVCGLGAAVVATGVLLHYLPKSSAITRSGIVSTAVLTEAATAEDTDSYGYPADSPLLNRVGTVVTALRPAGKIELDGQLVDVVAEGEFVEITEEVLVVQVEGNRIVVRPVRET